ncbi:MAG: ribosomal protein S18-alanine N-acetyltransferase [Candidatus Bathyarchaeia archaeon]
MTASSNLSKRRKTLVVSATPKEEFLIRPFKAEDLEAVYLIEKASFKDAWPKQSFLPTGKAEGQIFLVASHKGKVTGYVIAEILKPLRSYPLRGKIARLLNLAVDPHLRRRGLGSMLLKNVEDELKVRDVEEVALEVRGSNRGAVSFYLRHGFQKAGVIPYYYGDEDALAMTKNLRK